MKEIFSISEEIEQLVLLIDEDESIIKKLSVLELETLNEYLESKAKYLKSIAEE